MSQSNWQLTEKEGITEEPKSTDQMAWIGAINDIQARAREIVYTDIIYA
ncbi:MAG: TnpV protein [Lachnospiraceae bacterium]